MNPRSIHKQCFEFDAVREEIKLCVEDNHSVLVILRGASGSGKTFLAREMKSWTNNCEVYSPESLQSQKVATKVVRASVHRGTRLVIVDADNKDRGTIKKLAEVAITSQYECFVLEPDTKWKYDPEECAKRSSRGETVHTIKETIREIMTSPIEWKHLNAGGESNVEIKHFHSEFPVLSSFANVNGGSLLTASSSSSSSVFPVPLFSMKPPETKKVMRTVSTQVEVNNIAHVLAGGEDLPPYYAGFSVEKEELVSFGWRGEIRMIDRSELWPDPRDKDVKHMFVPLLTGTQEEIEFATLRCVFWHTDLVTLQHQLQTIGYEQAHRLFRLLDEPLSIGVLPVDDSVLLEEVTNEVSRSVSNLTIDEEMMALRVERLRMKRFTERINDTSSDELLARELQENLNVTTQPTSEFLAVDRENLALLQRMFPKTKPEAIRTIFVDIAFKNTELAKVCLFEDNNFYDPHHVRIPVKPTWSSAVRGSLASPGPSLSEQQKTDSEKRNHFLKESPRKYDLETVQREAVEERKKLESDRSSNVSYINHNKEHRNTVLMERAKRLNESNGASVKSIDEKLRYAHTDPYQLDLHYMTVDGAKKLVLDAIEAVQYKRRCDSRARNRITVVTGSGNNSRAGARIKPEVVKMLGEKNIAFDLVNDGCLLVKA